MKSITPQAFTLVELIVVITILAILGTIAFISLQGYSANARDSVRIANLTNMDKGLAIIQAKDGTLPLPEGSITTITSSGSHILTQGEFTQSMAEKILKMSGDITDPIDGTNPIYTTSSDKKYYQVALFLEAENLAIANINSRDRKYSVPTEILQNTHAADGKTFISRGSKLGVIMTSTETPVNQDSTPPTTLELNTTTTHIAYLDESTKLETSGTDLSTAVAVAVSKAGSLVGSCKDILDRGMGTTDGEYTIYPTNQSNDTLQVYCDMTTDGGGWTLVGENKNGAELDTRAQVGVVSLSPNDKDNWKLSDNHINTIKLESTELVNGFRITYDDFVNTYFWVSQCDFNSSEYGGTGDCGKWSSHYNQIQTFQSDGDAAYWKGLNRRKSSWGNNGWFRSSGNQLIYPCTTAAFNINECSQWYSAIYSPSSVVNPGINLWVK